MHLQQTKHRSRASGGPQYFFHDLTGAVKKFLRHEGTCKVVLETPYGIAESPFIAVGRDHKLDRHLKPVAGSVGHDRIQQGAGDESIGAAIKRWYGLAAPGDFERIDVDVSIHAEGHFILTPLRVLMRDRARPIDLKRAAHHLSFHDEYESPVWRNQIQDRIRKDRGSVEWAAGQMAFVLSAHTGTPNLHEADLLRASGALARLGLQLGPWAVRHYDCAGSRFRFLDYAEYSCPVEIKKRSRDFAYQMERYSPLPRAVVLCIRHDLSNVPTHIDVVDMSHLSTFLRDALHS